MASHLPLTDLRSRRGFTLVEVLVAVVVLAIGAAGLIQLLAQGQQQNHRRRSSEAARRIAENEVQRARSAGAWAVDAGGTTARVNQYGAPDADGEFRVYVDRDLVCDSRAEQPDDSGSGPPPCAGALARISVRVDHLREGEWTTRIDRMFLESGASPATGKWSPAGSE